MEAGGYADIVKPPNHDEYMAEKAKEAEKKKLLKEAEKGSKGTKRKAGEEEEAPKEKKTKEKEAKSKKESISKEETTPEKKVVATGSYKMGSPEKALVKKDDVNSKLWIEVIS